jgi:hypothetical protein
MFPFMNIRHNIRRVGFEFLKQKLQNAQKKVILIHTLTSNEQSCLILDTLRAESEESKINECLMDYLYDIEIVVYGKHSADESAEQKCKQLVQLGFKHVNWYVGGLFEWLLLQEIYGKEEFPTTGICRDLLYYRALT